MSAPTRLTGAEAAEHLATLIAGYLSDAEVAANAPLECNCEHDEHGHIPDTWFDRSICPEPCGSMHNFCTECSRMVGRCPVYARAQERARNNVALATHLLGIHAPHKRTGGDPYCAPCMDDYRSGNGPNLSMWPCPTAALACSVVGAHEALSVSPGMVS